MFCTNCGAQIQDGVAFCGSCGAAVAKKEPQSPPNYQQPNFNNYQQPPGYNYQQPNYQPPNYQQQNYQQNGGYYQAYGNPDYKAPIYSKNLGTCILLSIITCGIYGIVWFINMVNDLNTASQTPNDSNGTTVFLLGLVTCGIYQWYWLYKAGEKVNAINRMKGLPHDSSLSILYLALAFFGLGIVANCLIQSKLNEVAAYAE